MKNLQIDTVLAKIFRTLKIVKYESGKEENFGMWGKTYSWKPEIIPIRWKYKNDANFYMIEIIYSEAGEVKTNLNNFFMPNIGASLNQQNVSYYKKEKSGDIPFIMESLIRKDYGTHYIN